MCTDYASLTPEFYLHHLFIDKIWNMYQRQSKKHKYVYFSKDHRKMTKYQCPHSPSQLIDARDLPGCVRTMYSGFPYKKVKTRNLDSEENDSGRHPDDKEYTWTEEDHTLKRAEDKGWYSA